MDLQTAILSVLPQYVPSSSFALGQTLTLVQAGGRSQPVGPPPAGDGDGGAQDEDDDDGDGGDGHTSGAGGNSAGGTGDGNGAGGTGQNDPAQILQASGRNVFADRPGNSTMRPEEKLKMMFAGIQDLYERIQDGEFDPEDPQPQDQAQEPENPFGLPPIPPADPRNPFFPLGHPFLDRASTADADGNGGTDSDKTTPIRTTRIQLHTGEWHNLDRSNADRRQEDYSTVRIRPGPVCPTVHANYSLVGAIKGGTG